MYKVPHGSKISHHTFDYLKAFTTQLNAMKVLAETGKTDSKVIRSR